MGLSVKCKCPACFEEIYLGECKIVSGITSGRELKTPSKGILARMRVEPLHGHFYTLEHARRKCTACGYLLPYNIEKVPSIALAVVGDTFSGKSHYIAALIHQIKTEWLSHWTGCADFICLTQDVERDHKNSLEPFFTKGETLPPTSPASQYRKPLIYNLSVSPSSKHPPTEFNLMIYDASGEDFTREESLVAFARFALNASAFIFVADPFTMTPLFGSLPYDLQTNLQRDFSLGSNRRAVDCLNAIISVYKRFRKETRGTSLPKTPIAVMVSKSDLFKSFQNPYTFMTNPCYGNSIDLQDIDTIDEEVKDLLNKYQQGDLLAATRKLKRLKFFATSATGVPPDASGHFARVEPCRCLDPFLWILYQLGIIPASR